MLARQNNVSEHSKRPSVTARMCLVQSFPARDGALGGGGAFQLELPGWTPPSATDSWFLAWLRARWIGRQQFAVLRAASTPHCLKTFCEDSHLTDQVDLEL